MNFKSFVKGVLRPDNYYSTGADSTEDVTFFNETLAILLNVKINGHNYFTTLEWQTRLSEEVERIRQYDLQGAFEVYERLLRVFPSLPPVAFPGPTGWQ